MKTFPSKCLTNREAMGARSYVTRSVAGRRHLPRLNPSKIWLMRCLSTEQVDECVLDRWAAKEIDKSWKLFDEILVANEPHPPLAKVALIDFAFGQQQYVAVAVVAVRFFRTGR